MRSLARRRGIQDRTRRRGRLGLAGAAAAAITLGLAGCGDGSGAAGSGRPLVVATTTQLADFARQVGGDDVEVYGLLRPNVDAHDFEPSPADLDALARADVIVRNGLGLDPWLDDAVTASGSDAPVVDTSAGAHLVASAGDHDHDHAADDDPAAGDGHDHSGDWNPHLWFDPRNAALMADHVADAIVEAAPDDADQVRRRAERYDATLEELDRWIAAQLAPVADQPLVTDHDAFAYLVDRYDLTFVGSVVSSWDTSAELSAADLKDLVGRIRDAGVEVMFTERSMPPKAAEALARQADVEVVTGDDGLYGDSLGPEGSPGGTYVAMMRHNTTSIVTHLS